MSAIEISETPDFVRIRELVAELDRLVADDARCVRMRQYGGGPDESLIEATPDGGLRLGVVFLLAALDSDEFTRSQNLRLRLMHLLTDDSEVLFDRFVWCDGFEPVVERGDGKWIRVACVGLLAAMLVLAMVGVMATAAAMFGR